MFSTAQLDMCRSLVLQMREQGYLYYLMCQDYPTTNKTYDIYIYFSKEPIKALNQYNYTLPSGTLKYSLISGNYSANSSTGRRISVGTIANEQTLTIDVWQHISTNAEFTSSSIAPDLFRTEVTQSETQGGILFIFIVFIFFYAFIHLFRR